MVLILVWHSNHLLVHLRIESEANICVLAVPLKGVDWLLVCVQHVVLLRVTCKLRVLGSWWLVRGSIVKQPHQVLLSQLWRSPLRHPHHTSFAFGNMVLNLLLKILLRDVIPDWHVHMGAFANHLGDFLRYNLLESWFKLFVLLLCKSLFRRHLPHNFLLNLWALCALCSEL